MADSPPHKLDLYRLAVQNPLAEVAFVEHAWSHFYGGDNEPLLLREDFAGTCAVAAAWCASDPDRQAMAVERHAPTAEWAAERFDDPDLHIVADDVMAVDGPAVDVTVALNFSVLIYPDRSALLAYLSHAQQALNPGGLLILDLFGGACLERAKVQTRSIDPDETRFPSFLYGWEQGPLNEKTRRIDCRIHFELEDGTALQDAFVYEWRLWSAADLVKAAIEAGFAEASLWWSAPAARGRFRPITGEPAEDEWVAYVVCRAHGQPER